MKTIIHVNQHFQARQLTLSRQASNPVANRPVTALETITEFAYKLAMASPTLNPEADRIIPQARTAIAKSRG